MAHAILSPSAASRWMVCTRSARLEQSVIEESSEFAREGTLAHAIAEAIFKDPNRTFTAAAKKRLQKEFGEDFKKFYNAAMLRHCEDFVNYVLENAPEQHYLFVEHKLNISSFIEDGFGTMDAGLIYLKSDDGKSWFWVLETFDLKYGKGVPVSAEQNKQQMIYALGVLNDFGFIFDIEKVIMHIYQPRIANNSSCEITVAELLHWANTELKPKALLAFAGEGDFVVGDHCGFCKIKAQCKALAEYNLEMAKDDFKTSVLLSDEEFLAIYAQRQQIESWIKAIGEHALKTALHGKEWPGYKLVEGKANRKYKDPDKVAKILFDNDFTGIYTEPELLGLGALEDAIGSAAFIQFVLPELIKPTGQPTLAPVTDKRPIFNSAAVDFAAYANDNDLL